MLDAESMTNLYMYLRRDDHLILVEIEARPVTVSENDPARLESGLDCGPCRLVRNCLVIFELNYRLSGEPCCTCQLGLVHAQLYPSCLKCRAVSLYFCA